LEQELDESKDFEFYYIEREKPDLKNQELQKRDITLENYE
tara:strand:+ start:441 stop:560 length:120 start_codon:yes stop_codon:yes gene_type:complete